MKQILYGLLLNTILISIAFGQDNTNDQPAPTAKSVGKFNYTYIRLAYLLPSSGFNNPMASGFAGSNNFSDHKDASGIFSLGFESGKVRHFMKLDFGTPMVKLAINSGLALQAFGPDKTNSATTKTATDGAYFVRLGLGPQVTFKPSEDFRVGIYYRAGIALAYASYDNEQYTDLGAGLARLDKADIHLLNIAYNGDLGIDGTWRSLCIGFAYSMMSIHPAKLALVKSKGLADEYNAYTATAADGTKTVTPIDPKMKLSRIVLSLGFAF